LKKGPYGWYIQLGEALDKKQKPKRAPLPAGLKPENITLAIAKNLLALPKFIGNHPDTGEEMVMSIGKYGPYIKHQNKFASIPKNMDPFEIDVSMALSIIASASSKKKEDE
jgi:DNA topoisomerase I